MNKVDGGFDGVYEKMVMMACMMYLLPYIDTIPTCKYVSMLMHTLFHVQQCIVIIIYSSFPMYPI